MAYRRALVVLMVFGMLGCGGGGGGDDGPPADVAGAYIVDLPSIVSSNCDPRIVAEVATALANAVACSYDVTQSGNNVTVLACDGTVFRGSVDSTGLIDADATIGASNLGCGLTASIELVVPALQSPASATYLARFDFSANCVFLGTNERVPDCQGTAEARWTREG